mgnify:CR=1 FL=1|tara:strand:- start:700 stop:1980 length:1281 start_codon:yes stop_codon:yes gene_type:complete
MLSTATAAGLPQPGTTATGAPLRMAVVYKPNGVNYDRWKLEKTGQDYDLSPTLQPLASFKKDFQVFTGFEHQFGWGRLDGAGDHARANATFLTGVRPHKTAGSDIRLGISFDQVMANAIGDQTRLASLELSCDGVRKSGACDSGYSCAYQYNVSWRSETQPMTPESNPRLVFERLFGAGTGAERTENLKRRQVQQRSILDFVMSDAKKLHTALGRNDQQKLDEYLTGIREVEQAIEKSERFGLPPEPGIPAPSGIPGNFSDHLKLMFDMMVLAFETDSTRVATFMQSYDGSNRTFPDVGVKEGHHGLSHHRGKSESLEKLAKIDLFYSEHFAYFLQKLREKKDADGNTLLHNSMVLWGSGLSDPDRHRHDNLPIVLAGNGGGQLTPNRHIQFGENKPMTNLFLSMSEKMGVPIDQFGDSTGKIASI